MKNFSIEMIRKTKTMTLQEYLKIRPCKRKEPCILTLVIEKRYFRKNYIKAGFGW